MGDKIIRCVVEIVSAYVSHNPLRPEGVTELLAELHEALISLNTPKEPATNKPKPVVNLPWKKTIHRDYLISLIDGRQYKTLRRHLATRGLTPVEYRESYDLPKDYPMVAAAYSERRSAQAKQSGLGQVRFKGRVAASAGKEPAGSETAAGDVASSAKTASGKPKRKRASKAA